jgi:hypothetical protein
MQAQAQTHRTAFQTPFGGTLVGGSKLSFAVEYQGWVSSSSCGGALSEATSTASMAAASTAAPAAGVSARTPATVPSGTHCCAS